MAVVRLSTSLAAIMLTACVTAIDDGGAAGRIVIYEGDMPDSPDEEITTQVAIVEFPLPSPSFGDPQPSGVGVTATAEEIPAVAAEESTSGPDPDLFARIYDAGGGSLMDLDVTDAGGTGAIKIDATQIIQGVSVTIVSLLISQRNK